MKEEILNHLSEDENKDLNECLAVLDELLEILKKGEEDVLH